MVSLDFNCNLYEILEIYHQNITENDIKNAYHRLIKIYHPDKSNGNHDKYYQIIKAWEILKNKTSKHLYDISIEKNKSTYIYDEVNIDELTRNGDDYTYPCRCGESYFLDFSEQNKQSNLLIPCSNCSLFLNVKSPYIF
ncbi:unnamed protein product [Gordionus sp. m RMFG-2023]